jgi:hypothetical protein
MTWEAYFRRRGYRPDASQSALQVACAEWGVTPEELQDDADEAAVEAEWEFKYFHEDQPMDGRSARAHPAFAAVKADGRIDDAEARDRGMLNPH